MERINATNLYGLVPLQPEKNAMTKQSPTSLEKDMVILRWLRLAMRQYKEELNEEDIAFWIKSLSCFPQSAIEYAFNDYINFELDEFGRAWFPRVAQIKQKCAEFTERNAGPPTESGLSQEMAKWRAEEAANKNDPEWQRQYQLLKDKLKQISCTHGG
jgi:hypothetical protein